jgi:cell division ATPase FtsA
MVEIMYVMQFVVVLAFSLVNNISIIYDRRGTVHYCGQVKKAIKNYVSYLLSMEQMLISKIMLNAIF